jgi:hypothetical protein
MRVTLTISVEYDPECEDHPARWAWGEIAGTDVDVVAVLDTPDAAERAADASCAAWIDAVLHDAAAARTRND